MSDVVNLDTLKHAVESAAAANDFQQVTALLSPVAAAQPGTYEKPVRLWAHHMSGLALHAQGDREAAADHLEKAFSLDSADRDAAMAYSRLLAESGQGGAAVGVMRSLLVHHRDTLTTGVLAALFRFIGDWHYQNAELDEARSAFDQALVVDPNDHHAAEGMMRTINALDDPAHAVRAQRVMLRRLQDDPAKAAVLSHIGDDLWRTLDDKDGALRAFEEALSLLPGDMDLAEKQADLLVEMNRAGEAADVLRELLKNSPDLDPPTRLRYLDRTQDILSSVDGAHIRRFAVLNTILDLDPNRLDLFEKLTVACSEACAWDDLAEAYRKMIRRVEGQESSQASRALPLLWRNLGEVLQSHLEQVEEAYQAFSAASRLLPNDIGLRRRILDLIRDEDDKLLEALDLQRGIVALQPGDTAELEGFARLLLRGGRYDEALCVLRVLRAEGQWSERWERHFERLNRGSLRLPSRTLTDEMRRDHLRLEQQSSVLDALMMVAHDAFGKVFANDMGAVGIAERDKLDMGQDLLFVRQYDQIARLLGYKELPKVYVKRAMTGMANAIIDRPAFVIGPDMLSGKSGREIAFIVAQQLTLMRSEYVLTTIHQPVHLRAILLVLVNHVDPSIPVPQGAEVGQLQRVLDKYRKREARKHLEAAVGRLVSENLDVNVDLWAECVADEAARTGLLFCDDLALADRLGADSTGVMGILPNDERKARLHHWAVSDDYFRLRFDLGITVQEG